MIVYVRGVLRRLQDGKITSRQAREELRDVPLGRYSAALMREVFLFACACLAVGVTILSFVWLVLLGQ